MASAPRRRTNCFAGKTARNGTRDLAFDINSTRCYTAAMENRTGRAARVFKTAWFSKAARKAEVPDHELCSAMRQVMLGQADDLGGGVFKKRLGKNLYRSIIVAKGGRYWVYEYLFAKKDRANIDEGELAEFRRLAKAYATLTEQQLDELIQEDSWMEICHGDETQI